MSDTKTFDSGVKQMLETAVSAFGDTVKAGVKGQEQVTKYLSTALRDTGTLEEWQKRSKAILDQTTPAVHKSAEEWIKLTEQNYKRGVELLNKAVETTGDKSVTDVNARSQKLWQAAVELVRENAEATAQVNIRLFELWSDIARKNVEEGQTFVSSVTAKATATKTA